MFASPSKGSVSSLCGANKDATANVSPLTREKTLKESEGDSPIRKYNIRMKNNAIMREDGVPSKCLEEMKGAKPGSRPMERLNSLLRASSSYSEIMFTLDKRNKGSDVQNASALSV